MVHKHFRLIPPLTVTENILLGSDDKENRFFVKEDMLNEKVAQYSEDFGLEVNPKAKVWQLSVGEQQRVEIVKLLYRGTDIMILDEPSAVLTPEESDNMFTVLRKMADHGKSVVFISHKMNEVMSYADRITVLRNGSSIASVLKKDTTKEELMELMMGQAREPKPGTEKTPTGESILTLSNISVKNDMGVIGLSDVNITLH